MAPPKGVSPKIRSTDSGFGGDAHCRGDSPRSPDGSANAPSATFQSTHVTISESPCCHPKASAPSPRETPRQSSDVTECGVQ